MSHTRHVHSPAGALRRLLTATTAMGVVVALGLVGLPTASAAPLPAPYAAAATGTILGVSSSVVGATLAGTDVARSSAVANSSATPPSTATASNLGLRVGGLGASVDSHTVSAPPNATGSGPLVGVSVPALLDGGVLSYDSQANWASANACVGGTISSSRTQTFGASVTALVPILSTGVSTTTGTTSLVAQSAVHDTRSVRAQATGSVAGISLLGGAVSISTLAPTLTATATLGAASTASVSIPTLTVTSTLGTTTLAAGGSLTLDLGLVGKVSLSLADNSSITSSGGVFSVTALSVSVQLVQVVGPPLGSVSLGLLPLTASATAPTGGVECDTTAPAVAVTTPANGSTVGTTTPTLAGTSGVPSGTVSVSVDGGAARSVPTDASGAWTTTSAALTEGSHTVTATATDAASNSASASSTFTVDVLPTLAVTAPTPGSVTNNPRPTVTGTSGATTGTVSLTVDGAPAGSVPVDGTGAWTFTPATALPDGSHTIGASAVDAQGHAVSASTTFTVDATAPTIAITSPATGTTTNDSTPTVSGSTDQHGGTVTVRVDGAVVGTAVADLDGLWSVTPTAALGDGPHTVTASVTDAAGNTGTATSTVTVDATAPVLAITSPTPGQQLTTATPAVTGTSDVVSGTVSVAVDGGAGVPVTTSPTGAWSLPATAPLADGPHTITATATDAAGNTGTAAVTVSVDTTFPALAVLTPADGSTTNDATPTYSGTSDQPGRTVTVRVDGGTGTPVTTAADGSWTLDQATPLTNAPHTVTASVADVAGNVTTSSSTFRVDTTAPAIAVTAPADGDLTSDATPTFAGTSDQPGRTVTVVVDAGTPVGVVADPSGGWTLTPTTALADGPHTVRASVTNVAGTTSQATSSFTVDTTAPSLAVLTPATGSTTTDATPELSGTSDVLGGTVEVALDGAAPTAVATSPTGAWSTTPTTPLADGPHTVSVSATDAAGNVGAASSTFTVDATAPVVTVTAPPTGSRTGDATPTLAGTSDEPGDVSVVVDTAPAEVVPVTGGTWSTTAATLTDGPHTVTVTATDAAGNVGTASSTFVVDTTAPTVTISAPATGSATRDTTATYAGTTDELGGSVSVSVDGGAPVVLAAASTDGAWTTTPTTALTEGPHTVTATVVDDAGNTGVASSTFTVDTTAPVVSVDTPADGSLTNGRRPAVTGTVDAPGSTVSVVLDSAPAVDVTSDASGTWTLPLVADLVDGDHTLTATQTDAAGNTGTGTSTFTVDATAPDVAVLTPADGSTTNDTTPTVSGTSSVLGGTVSVAIDGGTALAVPTASDGAWSTTPAAPLTEGPHTATVTATDAAGNVSRDASSFDVDLTAPSIAVTAPANGSVTGDATPAITGTSDQPLSSVAVTLDGGAAALVTSDAAGAWRLDLTAPLGEGGHTVEASVSDPAGNVGVATSTFVIDLTAPALEVQAPATGSTTNDPTPTVSGTSDAIGRTVSVVVDGQPALTVVVAGDGTWSVTTATPLSDGPRTATATVSDAVGNVSTASSTFTVDTTAPAVDITAPVAGSTTTDATPTISGTSGAPGGTVTVVVDGGAGTTVTAGPDGAWELIPASALADGPHTVTASVTDPAGNTGTASTSFTVDATAPLVTVLTPAAGSTTNDRTPTFSGTTDAFGATVVVVVDSGTAVPVTAGPTGAWTLTPTTLLGDGTHTVTASVTDPAGNVGTASSTFTVDGTAPVVTVTAPADGSSTNDATPTVTGTTDVPGGTVTVTLDGRDPVDVVADGAGTWSTPTAPALGEGLHTVSASATDPSGNTGTATSSFTVDTTAPAVAVTSPANGSTTSDATPTVTGTSSLVEGTVAVSIDGAPATTVDTGTDGSWTTTTTAVLVDGPHTVTAVVTDGVGNTGTAGSTFTVDTVDPSVAVTAPADGSVSGDDTPTITGTSSGGDGAIAVSVDGAPAVTVPTDAGGAWSTVWTTPLDDGPHTVTATVTDAAANTATTEVAFSVDTAAPTVVVTAPASGSTTTDPTPVVTGTSDEPGTVTVSIDGGTPVAVTVAPDGSWTLTPTSPLADGSHTVTASATDAAGNTGSGSTTFTVDTTAPELAITAPADGSTTADSTPDVIGTSDQPGATVTVVVDGGDPVEVTASATDGSWTAATGPLTDGEHTAVATVSDAAGNVASADTTFTVDATAPTVTVTAPVGGSTISDATPTLTGTSSEPGRVLVVVDGGTPATVAVATDGTWSLPVTTALGDGPHEVVVTATDAAGNEGSTTSTFVVDTTGPSIAVTSPADGSTSSSATPPIEGTSDQPATAVRVSVDGGPEATVTSDGTGGWSLQPAPTLADGQHSVSAATTDGAGNTSTATSTFTVDTTGPVLQVTSPADGGTTADPTPTISGTSDLPDGVVQVSVDGGTPVEVATGPDGSWSTTVAAPLAPGPHQVAVTATDAAGNTGSTTSTFTVELVAPVITITAPADGSAGSDTTPTVAGTSTVPDAVVTVTIADGETFTTTSDAEGGWATAVPTPLADGSYQLTASVTDAADQEASDSVGFTVDTTAPEITIVTPADGAVIDDPTPVISGTSDVLSGTLRLVVAQETAPVAGLRVTSGAMTLAAADAPAVTVPTAADGSWSYTPSTPYALGTQRVTTTVSDEAGNTATDTHTFRLVAAATVTITSPADGSTTTDATPPVTGTGTPGLTVLVTVDDAPATSVVVGDDGVWSHQPTAPLALGDHEVRATLTNEAGTTADVSATFTVAPALPGVPVIRIISPRPGSTVTDSTPTVTGTVAGGGSRVTVSIDGVGSDVAVSAGAFSFTPTAPLECGPHTAAVTATGTGGDATQTVSFALACSTGGTGGTGGTTGGSGTGGALPGTGSSVGLALAWSVVLLALGMVLSRRRREGGRG